MSKQITLTMIVVLMGVSGSGKTTIGTLLAERTHPAFADADTYLRHLTYQGAEQRYGTPLPDKVVERLEYELGVIGSMGFSDYFLVVWDLIRYARDRRIRVGPGRGSAAGCCVAYCLTIVDVDEVGEDALLVHDPHRADPGPALSLAKLAETPSVPTPIGIFRDVDRPVYRQSGSARPATDEQLADLLMAGDTWTVAG